VQFDPDQAPTVAALQRTLAEQKANEEDEDEDDEEDDAEDEVSGDDNATTPARPGSAGQERLGTDSVCVCVCVCVCVSE
jgi:hypothetical protein